MRSPPRLRVAAARARHPAAHRHRPIEPSSGRATRQGTVRPRPRRHCRAAAGRRHRSPQAPPPHARPRARAASFRVAGSTPRAQAPVSRGPRHAASSHPPRPPARRPATGRRRASRSTDSGARSGCCRTPRREAAGQVAWPQRKPGAKAPPPRPRGAIAMRSAPQDRAPPHPARSRQAFGSSLSRTAEVRRTGSPSRTPRGARGSTPGETAGTARPGWRVGPGRTTDRPAEARRIPGWPAATTATAATASQATRPTPRSR